MGIPSGLTFASDGDTRCGQTTAARRPRPPECGAAFDPEIGYLGYVTSFLDTMIEEGTDRYGDVHSPMFVGMLEIDTHEHPGGYIPWIPGQRMGDRPFWGANLVHDRPLLEAMTYVSDYTGKTKYRDADTSGARWLSGGHPNP